MTPDRMVVDEARRTFTYLNLYGYLTDAVVVNRLFPEEVGPYFGAWRERQLAALAEVRSAFAPVPVLCAPSFGEEVVGPDMLDHLGARVFEERDPGAVLHQGLTQELVVGAGAAELRMDLPFAEKGEISLKKIGLELVVRVDGHKRTLMLPPALGDYRPTGASFDDGALHVTFDAPG
jgi:arsenite/tail-anchored protein-transporting ATPase